MSRRKAALLVLFVALVLASCGRQDGDNTVLVMAAASLTDAFGEIEEAFEAAHPSIDVQLNVAGSTSLREQILQGAPADVFASANTTTMRQVAHAGAAESWQFFATNELVLAVPIGNPGAVTALMSIADPDLLIGLCDRGVPCGVYARTALGQVGIEQAILEMTVDTNERDARALLTKLEAGELDVGLVYATDVAASERVEGIRLPPEIDVPIDYPIAMLRESGNHLGAQTFMDFVLSAPGQAILGSHGFGSPESTDARYRCSDEEDLVLPTTCIAVADG